MRTGRRLPAALCCLAWAACATPERRERVYARPDGVDLKADLHLPEGRGPFPAVVVIHGGGWTGGRRRHMDPIARRLAQRGFVAMNISYRLAPAHLFPAALHDCKAAVRWLRAHATELRVDPERIGAFGYSAGAHLAAMLAVTRPADGLEGPGGSDGDARVRAIVAGGTPADLRKWPESPLVNAFLGVDSRAGAELWRRASPVVYVSSESAPAFLYHALRDRLVEPKQAELLRDAYAKAGAEAETRFVRGLGHVTLFVLNRSAVREGIAFLERKLGSYRAATRATTP